ncbi:hypothetical protein CNMCM7691_001601 [Aspergillus felis]|uniref:GH18 domain-containing protein n=1 Tax=Aspergillus felis TaxID=1287682 RepID=A0A8H6V3A7_9EURO|nr:hypothetical protein CNMCM7691_001601 [Aspergillus felis]
MEKVLLGLGFYGRSFTLADSSCNTPGCKFYTENKSTGGAVAGECTGTSGILSDYEISRIINDYSVNVMYDETAGVNWMTWSGNQWRISRVSFDNGRTLKQKADFANSKCLGGLFGWALDLGGPGSLKSPNGLTAGDTSMGGANIHGGSDGTGNFYAGQEVLGNSPTVTAIAPVNIIFPKAVLDTPTTIDLGGGYPTSLEVAWSTTKTVTVGSITKVTSTITRYIMSTTIPLTPITTNRINYYNWNISDLVTGTIGTLIPSIEIPPVVITDHPNPLNETGVTHLPLVTRTVSIPPWPWNTDGTKYPSVTFTQGNPPGPTCTANCGHRCYGFCDGPCLSNCGTQSSSSFIDPLDTDAPSVSKCSGPGCVNGKCTNRGLCIERGCTGNDCKSRVCLGDNCIPTACAGSDCKDGHCNGNNCQKHGCIGDDCDGGNSTDDHDSGGRRGGSGRCFGPRCLSWGCTGKDCSSTDFTCTGPLCRIVTCSGSGCSNGVCSGNKCKSEDSDCETEEADSCTEYISSKLVTPVSTYSTTTVTSHCETITACAARPTTVTSTIDADGLNEGTIFDIESGTTDDPSLTSWLDEQMSSQYATTTSTTTSSTTKATSTTSSAAPTPTSADGCALMGGIQGVCWNKCDPVTGNPVGGAWEEGDPWCWLKDGDIGAFCNKVKDCPSKLECQPSSWKRGGCAKPKPASGGCALMNGIQGVCWSKCDPATSEPVQDEWKKGDPWCWLESAEQLAQGRVLGKHATRTSGIVVFGKWDASYYPKPPWSPA